MDVNKVIFDRIIWVMLAVLSGGCASTYENIPFAWTSDHRLAPNERMLSLNASPNSVFNALQKWVKDNKGVILSNVDDHLFVYDVQPNSDELFQAAQEILHKHWTSYDKNIFLKWDDKELNKLKELTESQIKKDKSEIPSYVLEAKIAGRTGNVEFMEEVGSKRSSPIYNSGFTAYKSSGSGIRSVSIPGYAMTVPTPIYEKRTKTLHFHSAITFVMFHNTNGSRVYAVGSPVDDESGLRASYGNTIGFSWWPKVTGKEEASLIRESYIFLSDLDKAGKLERFSAEE